MRQTETFGFKLMDGTDRLSPGPMNENMEAVEDALLQSAAALAAAVGSGGSNARIATGTYEGTGVSSTAFTFETGFRPLLLFLIGPAGEQHPYYDGAGLVVYPQKYVYLANDGETSRVEWRSDGVVLTTGYMADPVTFKGYFNQLGTVYTWVAVGDTPEV